MPVENIDHDKCIGCGACVATCPTDVLRMDAKTRKARIAYQEDCQICRLCQVYCPVDAIRVSPVKCVRPMVGWG
ncbi:ferredoxin family protein [Pontiella sp.]|uniref:4Fe-4S dicluster domain-containing protein n=1 Tax=Pontiella sp. TaxID=2837462 RepID=UPI003569BFB8